MNNLTAIQLSDEDSAKFLLFMKHYDIFTFMLTHGIFQGKNTTITLNYDHNGILQKIERKENIYVRQRAENTQ